ncbi:hypothetical protein [Flavobacterium rhizosphaerae]|uniref:Uncharacterized protein n=1 Tax=Flavobacterium rhizosphaerae TaxID=3163298 RepID=A0ABW8YYL2_9FLAO
MRQYILYLLIIIYPAGLYAQTDVSAQPLILENAKDRATLMPAPEAEYNQMVVYAADDKTVTALHYNSALFFTGRLQAPRPGKGYEKLAGYSFSTDTAYAYWVPGGYVGREIMVQGFNFTTGNITTKALELPVKSTKIIRAFNGNNVRYVLAKTKDKNKLDLCVISGSTIEKHTLDFSGIRLKNHNGKSINIKRALKLFPMSEVSVTGFNSLPEASSTTKLYVLPDALLITMDHYRNATQSLRIDLKNYTVTGNVFDQPLDGVANTASFYNMGTLYQLAITKDKLELKAVNFDTGKLLKTYTAEKNDSIPFATTGLKEQTGSNDVETIDTRKFLKRASMGSAALSVYHTPNDILVSAGAVRYVTPGINIFMGAVVTMAGGESGDYGFDDQDQQTQYFESLFDENFNYLPFEPQLLAVDHINDYLNNKSSISLATVVPFTYYYILGYYDTETKQYILRRFEDDSAY